MTQQQPAGGFNWARLSMGSKGLLVTGLLLLIALFLPWRTIEGCDALTAGLANVSCSETGFAGLGVFVGLLTIALLVWEILLAVGVNVSLGTVSPALVSAGLAGGIVLLGLIRFLTALGGGPLNALTTGWGAYLGLVLLLAVAYAGYVRFQESKVGTAPPPPVA
jgi:hypothetical protein